MSSQQKVEHYPSLVDRERTPSAMLPAVKAATVNQTPLRCRSAPASAWESVFALESS